MGFLSCLGRTLFAFFFLFTAWQEFNAFGIDGGPKAKALRPKIGLLNNHVTSAFGVHIPEIESKNLVAAGIALKGTGGILFVLGSPIGAYLLMLYLATSTPILHDFYHHNCGSPEFYRSFLKFTQDLALFGALLFLLGMKKLIQRRHSKKRPPKSKTS